MMIDSEPLPLTPQPKERIWTWLDLVIILLGSGIILIAGGLLLTTLARLRGVTAEELAQPTIAQSLGLAALEAGALVIGIYLFGLRRKRLGWPILGLRPVSGIWILVTIVVSVFAIPITGIITMIVLWALGLPLDNPQLDFLLPEDLNLISAIGMILLAGVAVPFAEELLFRGFLYTFIKERLGIWPGVLISSLIFGVIHANFAVGLTAFLLGILLAVLFEYSHSLWTSILVHAINNSAKIAILYILVQFGLDNFR